MGQIGKLIAELFLNFCLLILCLSLLWFIWQIFLSIRLEYVRTKGTWIRTDKSYKVWLIPDTHYARVTGFSRRNFTATWSGAADVNGYATGQGILQWFFCGNPEIKYEGSMLNGKKHGEGMLTWPSGKSYKGEFVNDKRTGKGIFTWSSGDCYEGDFVDDKEHGNGILTWPCGKNFQGQWSNGRLVK